MGILRNIVSGLFNHRAASPAEPEVEPAFDLEDWNRLGRAKAQRVCGALEAIIDRGEDADDDFFADERTEEFADAVLGEVVALNKAGRWQQARDRFDPAHQPFVSHMGDLGLDAVVILGPERFLVRLGDDVLHIDDGHVARVEGASMFAVSRNRRWLVIATGGGLTISSGFDADPVHHFPWPEGIQVRPVPLQTLDIADDGLSIALASDEFGIWFVRDGVWTLLAPRPGVGDEDDGEDGLPGADTGAVRNLGTDACPVYFGNYAQLKAQFGGPLGLDAAHAAVSPDGRFVAYGWQDATGGHYVDRVTDGSIQTLGRIEAHSDYPYHVRFTDDSRQVISNSRHFHSGVTVCREVSSLAQEDNEPPAATDEYLRAYGMALLPGARFGRDEPVAWIGGAGWSHAAPLGGGKPLFTHLLGSALRGFDFDPVSGLVAVASASGVLHVLNPFCEAEAGRERGYHPRRELFRWIFWETLDEPIRW